MIRLFKRRRPAHRAVVAYGYKVQQSKPELCGPCIDLYGYDAVRTEVEDITIAHAWGLTLTQWWALTDFERSECRRNVTVAPRFAS